MVSRHLRFIAALVAIAVSSSGCMLSRYVDRSFIGITVRHPTYEAHKTTGIFLLPFTFAIDVVTFPIQALLVVILGDGFPYDDANSGPSTITLRENPQFQRLDAEAQKVALAELEELRRAGRLSPNSALGLGEDGHWTVVELTAEARSQLIARATTPAPAPQQLCAR